VGRRFKRLTTEGGLPDSSLEMTIAFHSTTFSIRPANLGFGAVIRTLNGARFMGKHSMSFLIIFRACATNEAQMRGAMHMTKKFTQPMTLTECLKCHITENINADSRKKNPCNMQ
jgi:hypothetical protein